MFDNPASAAGLSFLAIAVFEELKTGIQQLDVLYTSPLTAWSP